MFIWIRYRLMGLFCSPHSRDTVSLSTNSWWRCGRSPLQGQKASGWGLKCNMSLTPKRFLGTLACNLSSETVRLTGTTDVLGAMNYKSDWHCHGAGRERGSNQKANISETEKRVSVAPCLWIFLWYLVVVLCGETGLTLWSLLSVKKTFWT